MFKFSRLFFVYVIAALLALILGYLVSSPDRTTFMVIIGLLFFFSLPFFLKWHHVLLIVFWNSMFNFAFLPGSPDFWLTLAFLSFGISFLSHIMFQKRFLRAPELTYPVLFLAAVVVFTGWYRGGIGVRALGGASYGGKNYITAIGAILGYFAFTAERIPIQKGRKMADWFFLSGAANALSSLVYMAGPAFYFLYLVVPTSAAIEQASSEYAVASGSGVERISALASTSIAIFCFLLAHFGIRGLFDMSKPWRFVILCLTVGAGLFAGFRSAMATLVFLFVFQFYFEGLMRTHLMPVVIGLAICGFIPCLFFAQSLPQSVQRAISFLPVNVDFEVGQDAKASTGWRHEMWADVWKDVPKYLIIGKGYSVDPEVIYMANLATHEGAAPAYEGAMVVGNYHNGPLSVLIPFGILGMIGFVWVLIGGYRVLYANLRFGDARLRLINGVLLSYYLAYCISFFFIFGAFNSELNYFLGICGFSVSLNGGVRRRAAPKRQPIPAPQTLAMEPG
jgi:hypothetical protein